jgi:transposase
VTEVAERYGVSRQSAHAWLRRYRDEGLSGLTERSHKVRHHPWQIPAEVESAVCELRGTHPRWGPKRLVFEMGRRGYGTITRSTVYRVLVRNGLVEPKSRRRRRQTAPGPRGAPPGTPFGPRPSASKPAALAQPWVHQLSAAAATLRRRAGGC